MDFDFSDEQKAFQDLVRRMLQTTFPPEALRDAADGDLAPAGPAWRGLADMGCLGAAIPEALGGVGAGYLELCLVAEEIGRANLPVPFISSICLAAEFLLSAGSSDQKQAWLPSLCRGEAIGCVAWPRANPKGPVLPPLTWERGRLRGTTASVTDAGAATLAIVAVPGGAAGGSNLVLVDLASAGGVTRIAVDGLDPTRPRARLSFEDTPGELLGAAGQGDELLRRVIERAAILVAFQQIGGAQRCLEMGRDYALTRYAFGRVIGSYQAIKHKLADIYARNRLAIAHAYHGAWALSMDAAETPLAAAAARVTASDAFNFAAQENLQTHGGIGFTWEHPCHLFYRRARFLSLELGSPHEWREAIATQLIETNAAQGTPHGL